MTADTFNNLVAAIFRFRDLVTSEGGTIRNHEDLAIDHHYVWWGWWKKPGESVPTNALRAIHKRPPTRIYLFDSGRLKLYKVDCDGFHWDTNLTELPSPEAEKTPAYYRDEKYLMWMKLKAGFAELGPEEVVTTLKRYSYRRVDEVFANRKSRYEVFYDKQVFDLEELQQQDRTIWFVQDWQQEHAVNKVVLTAANRIMPEHFSSTYIESKFRSLLWVSDLHCGSQYAFAEDAGDQNRQTLPVAVENALKHQGVADKEIAGVLVSGDLTWQGDPKEFESAYKAIVSLMRTQEHSGDFYRYLVCPGNHDLRFSDDPAKKDAPVKVAPDKAREGFSEFYTRLFFLPPNDYLCSGRKFLLGGCIPVEVAAINTSLLDQKKDWFQGHGFVGHEQLKTVEEQFGWQTPAGEHPRPYRILMMHHHLVPTEYVHDAREKAIYSTVLDTGPLIRFIVKHGIDLVIHGHMHEHFLSVESRLREDGAFHTFYVAGLGSTGLKKGQHQTNDSMVGLLSFSNMRYPTLTVVAFGPKREPPRIVIQRDLLPPSFNEKPAS